MTETEVAWLRAEFLRCRPWIEAALKRDVIATHDAEDVWELIKAGHAQLWPTPNSVVVTKIDAYPKARVLTFWVAGGKLKEIRFTEAQVYAWARVAGCTFAAIAGRRGWARALKGYKETGSIVVRKL